jgi:hypothetical protein
MITSCAFLRALCASAVNHRSPCRTFFFGIIAGFALALALLGFVSCSFPRGPARFFGPIAVEAVAVAFDARDPPKNEVGKLVFVSGFVLKSSDPRFGGLSGLSISADGAMLIAVSDRGYWISANMRHESNGRLTGFGGWDIEALLAPDGARASGKLADAEGLTRDRDGSVIVSFEQVHRLWRYAPAPATFHSVPVPVPVPGALARAPANGGVETVAAMPDGRLIILTEELRQSDGTLAGWILKSDRFEAVSYVPSEGFVPSDGAALKNGDLLVLERRLTALATWEARIKHVAADSLHEGARIRGTEVARIQPPFTVDNFEAMAVYEHPSAGTFLYLVSDDNYIAFQQTLLLQFQLRR